MRLEEARAAFDRANNRELRMKQLIAQFRAQYDTASRDFMRMVSLYVIFRKSAKLPADLLPPLPSDAACLGAVDKYIEALRSAQPHRLDNKAVLLEQRKHLALCLDIRQNISRELVRLKELAPEIRRTITVVGCCYDDNRRQITMERIRAACDNILCDFPGSVGCTLDTEPITSFAVSADSLIITEAATRLATDVYARELAEATALLAAVTKREAGPAAYIDGIVLEPAMPEYVGGYRPARAGWGLPGYVVAVMTTVAVPCAQLSPEEAYVVQTLFDLCVDPLRILRKPGDILSEWIARNRRADDKWPVDIGGLPGLWHYRSGKHLMMAAPPGCRKILFDVSTLRGRRDGTMEEVPVVTAAQLRSTLATMLHMYEVLIDRVYGSPKRRADDNDDQDVASAPKRTACSD